MAASIQPAEREYDVGGVLLARPFQITRLGHFGLSLVNFDAGVRFYTEILGFRISERQDVADDAPALVRPLIKMIKDRDVVMLRHNTEHHTLVLISTTVNDLGERMLRKRTPVKDITVNQITWQVGSLAEVVNGRDYFEAHGIRDPQCRPRHAWIELALLRRRLRGTRKRNLLWDRADRLGRQKQANDAL